MSKPSSDLDTPAFAAAFAGDVEPVRKEFTIAGRSGFVLLLPMDFGARQGYGSLGVRLTDTGAISQIDFEPRARHLISRTVIDWSVPTRERLKAEDGGGLGDWSTVVAPPGNRKVKIAWLEANMEPGRAFDLGGEFGQWLADECLRVNGMLGEQEKNSSEPSSD